MWELISWEVDVMVVDHVGIDLTGVDLAGGPRNDSLCIIIRLVDE